MYASEQYKLLPWAGLVARSPSLMSLIFIAFVYVFYGFCACFKHVILKLTGENEKNMHTFSQKMAFLHYKGI